MNDISPSMAILSSMITPAVLILASGSLILTTSQRLSRVIERVRNISKEFIQIGRKPADDIADENKRRILYKLLKKSARRSKLLTRAMTLLYISLGLFVATSLTIGIVGVTHSGLTWIPTAVGMIGAVFLFVSSFILIVESRLTLHVISDEVDFVIESSKHQAPEPVKKQLKKNWRSWLRLWTF